jgi:ATP-dependent exoDNAse (exonuclease V) alpha subunit
VEYRQAVQELRRDPESGFQKLDAMGAIREVPLSDWADAIKNAYMDAQSRTNEKGSPSEVLVIAANHDEIGRVTEAIRAERTQRGELGQSVEVERYVALNLTTAQKREARNYQAGQVLKFHRAVKEVAKNESLEIVRAEQTAIVARNSQGEERTFTAKQAKAFDVYERSNIEVATNDKLLLLENRREPGFHATNGELVTVAGIDENGRVRLHDGRTLPEDYKQFTHGYAVTTHRSQGKSVDQVIISSGAMRKELFYVAASQGREGITVVTSDKNRLRESIARSESRQSVSELIRWYKEAQYRTSSRSSSAEGVVPCAKSVRALSETNSYAEHLTPESKSPPKAVIPAEVSHSYDASQHPGIQR